MNIYTQMDYLNSPDTSNEILAEILSYGIFVKDVLYSRLNDKKFTEEMLDKASKMEVIDRMEVAMHPNVPMRLLRYLSRDKFPIVREEVYKNPKVCGNLLYRGLSDPDLGVQEAVFKNPNAKYYHILTGLRSWNFRVKNAALNHVNLTKDTLLTALKYESDFDTTRLIYNRLDSFGV